MDGDTALSNRGVGETGRTAKSDEGEAWPRSWYVVQLPWEGLAGRVLLYSCEQVKITIALNLHPCQFTGPLFSYFHYKILLILCYISNNITSAGRCCQYQTHLLYVCYINGTVALTVI